MKITFGILVLVLSAACATASGRVEAPPGKAPEDGRITVTVVPGEHYSHRKWVGIFPVKLTPTMAVWAEDEEGRFKGTLFVTKKAAEGSWTGAAERPEALPVYFGRRKTAGSRADSVSGATPSAAESIRIGSGVELPPGTYNLFAEVNSSFDYNDAYPKAETGVNGQPSLVYAGRLVSGSGPAATALAPFGTGDPAGKGPGVTEGLNGLTTALGIVEKITVEAH
jgi:hypothetical protein